MSGARWAWAGSLALQGLPCSITRKWRPIRFRLPTCTYDAAPRGCIVRADELTKPSKLPTLRFIEPAFYRPPLGSANLTHLSGSHLATCTRSAHGQHTVSARSARGQHTVSARSAHGQHTVSARSAHGQRLPGSHLATCAPRDGGNTGSPIQQQARHSCWNSPCRDHTVWGSHEEWATTARYRFASRHRAEVAPFHTVV